MSSFSHSAKGTTWNIHKYTDKITKNGKTTYVYPEDNKSSNPLSEYEDKFNDIVKNLQDSGEDTKTFIQTVIGETGVTGISNKDLNNVVEIVDKMLSGGELSAGDYLTATTLKLKYGKDLDKIIDALASKTTNKQESVAEYQTSDQTVSKTETKKQISTQSTTKTNTTNNKTDYSYVKPSKPVGNFVTTSDVIIKDIKNTASAITTKARTVSSNAVEKGKQVYNNISEKTQIAVSKISDVKNETVEKGKEWLHKLFK